MTKSQQIQSASIIAAGLLHDRKRNKGVIPEGMAEDKWIAKTSVRIADQIGKEVTRKRDLAKRMKEIENRVD